MNVGLKIKQTAFMKFGPAGIFVGASLAATAMKYSRRNIFIGLNLVGILSCIMSVIDNFYLIIFGRFLYGAVGGVMLSITPKML
jgi:predicted MFS family arabinose efflux permease